MKQKVKQVLRSSAVKLMLLIGLFSVNAVAMAAASVSLTSPAPNTKVAAPGSFVLTATASSTNSTVKSVAFYRGTTLLKTVTVAPYTYTWTNVAAGTYSLTAKATDNKNATATSAAVSVSVINDTPPTVSLTSPAANTVSNAPASFTLSATAASTTSTIAKVDFYNGSTLIGTATTSPYSVTWSNVAAGTYSLTAKATDALGKATTSTAVAVISNAVPTVSITSPANNTAVNAPASFILSASAADSDGTIAKVEYFNGATLIGSATASPYSVTWSNVAIGTYSITAKATDNRGAVTTSAPITLISKQTTSSTSVSVTPNPAKVGQATTLSATVTGTSPSGTVTFKDGATTLGTGTLTAGVTSLNYTFNSAGSHSITAVYAGDTNNTSSTSAAAALTVNTATSTTTVTATPNPATAGQAATLAASVTGVNPTGTVTFMDGTTTLGTGTLTAGATSLSYTFNTAGAHSITVVYAGDTNNTTSTSAATALTVNTAASTTTLTATPNPITIGNSTTLNATVTGLTPGGTVNFMEGTTTLGSATLTAGAATFSYTPTTAAAHSITAVYAGDSNNTTSTSTAVSLTVDKVVTTTSLNVTPNPAKPGDAIVMNATVTGSTPAGSVTFMDGATVLGTSPVNTGLATFTTSFLIDGPRAITAVYSGDPINTTSTSTIVNLAVNKVASTTVLNVTPNPAKPGDPIVMNATITGFNPAGSVTFMDGATVLGTAPVNTGLATFTTSFLIDGPRAITAVYSGDPVNTSSTSIVVNLAVNKVASTTALTVTPNPARPGEPVTMTATVTGFNPSGVVSFMDGGYVVGGANLIGGVATFSISFPATGSHTLSAMYGADAINQVSTSAPVTLTINTGVAQVYYIHTDQLNTPRTITDTSGAVVWQWDNSDPFGNNAANENPNGAGAFNFNLRFAGQYFDKETNTHYNINRDYDPATGRYVESDPIGLRGGINTYGYVGGNPLSYIDPMGLLIVTVNTGSGPYSSTTMVWNSWVPSFYTSGTTGGNGTNIESGIYTYNYGQHPMNPSPGQTSYPALNLYSNDGSRTLPATRTDGLGDTAAGINVHKGNRLGSRRSGSQACHVIPKENWNDFIQQFDPGDNGTYIYIRLQEMIDLMNSVY